MDRTLVLSIPFEGKIPEPKTNAGWSTTADGKKTAIQTVGPYLLAITWLRVEDEALHVTLGMENWSRTLVFGFVTHAIQKQKSPEKK